MPNDEITPEVPGRDIPYRIESMPAPAALPAEVLKRKNAINLYYIAEIALAAVVVLVPVLSRFGGALPAEIWNGWIFCIGGLVALLGGQNTKA